MKKKFNIFFVIDETTFHHPSFFNNFVNNLTDNLVGVGLVTKIKKKNSLDNYFFENLSRLYISEVIKLVYLKYTRKILDKFSYFINRHYTVKSVLKKNNINFFEIHYDINKEEYLKKIKQLEVDIIISSNSLIFKKELLSIPKICVINRHSALLPSYGGLLPVFQSFIHGEKFTGVSIHYMNNKIDDGEVIVRESIKINKGDTLDSLYKRCFAISSKLILNALDIIRNKESVINNNNIEKSYFSFPTKSDWLIFRKKGGKII